MLKQIILAIFFLQGFALPAQDLSYSKPGVQYYSELPNPVVTDKSAWNKMTSDIAVSYASDNVKYPKEKIPGINLQTTWSTTAWKGEKVHTQFLVWSKKDIPAVSFQLTDLVSATGKKIPATNMKAAFVRYTMADNFVDGCSQKATSRYDSFLVADPIDIVSTLPVAADTVQPVWLNVEVPANTSAGKYTGTITVNANKKFVLKINLDVVEH